jgi:exonuclease SbcC
VESDEQRVAAALEGHRSIAERIAALHAEADAFAAATEASRTAESAKADCDIRASEWATGLADAPFDTRDEVMAARLEETERSALVESLDATDRRRAQLGAELSGPDLVDVDVNEVIDVAAADAFVAQSEAAQQAVHDQLAQLRQRLDDSVLRAAEVDAALTAHAEIERSTAPVIRMADLVSGSTPDNVRSMSLPTFVLRERFADVVASANDRLATMSDGRYTLEHVEDREGNKRSGLGLRVRDTHTDQPRDPGTLSGGETFYCSLAMALGLADVVTAEAGGVDLGTLFVDEGFGSLDPDTLDNVLSVLSGLGTSGRVVGIVSHVPELKERIAERITVVPNRDGSSRLVVSA